MRVASCVTSKAAANVTGSLNDRFAPQANTTTVQLRPENVAIISQNAEGPRGPLIQQATPIADHNMINKSALKRDQLFIANNECMKNDASHLNRSHGPSNQQAGTVGHSISTVRTAIVRQKNRIQKRVNNE